MYTVASRETNRINRSNKTFKLNNGHSIPAVGLGTAQALDDQVYKAVLSAIEIGYRHIDTAAGYKNEESVGKAIKDSGIPRDELFITTKLAPIDATRSKEAFEQSLERLGVEYIDLYLIHWPIALNPDNKSDKYFPSLPNGNRDILLDWSFVKTWESLQEFVESGKVKSIGVSNFLIKNLKELFESPNFKIKPVINQVELHPYLPQHELLAFATKHDILLEAYSPLGSNNSPLLKDETVSKIADKYNVSVATILISWSVWRGVVVIPKSVSASRIETNFQVVDLKEEDGKALNDLWKVNGTQRFINPNWDPVNVFEE